MKRGFTLIELLVVVLIIGILAAIALPQYQKAVVRSEGMKMLMLLKEYSIPFQHYVLSNGTYPTRISQLESLPAGWSGNTLFSHYGHNTNHAISNGRWSMQLSSWGKRYGLMMGMIDGPYAGCGFYMPSYTYAPGFDGVIFCVEVVTEDVLFAKENGDCCMKIFNAKPVVGSSTQVVSQPGRNAHIPFHWFLMP